MSTNPGIWQNRLLSNRGWGSTNQFCGRVIKLHTAAWMVGKLQIKRDRDKVCEGFDRRGIFTFSRISRRQQSPMSRKGFNYFGTMPRMLSVKPVTCSKISSIMTSLPRKHDFGCPSCATRTDSTAAFRKPKGRLPSMLKRSSSPGATRPKNPAA